MAKGNLADAMKELPAEEKARVAEAFVRYETAKKNGSDVAEAYNEVRTILKDLERKCNTTIFVPIVPEEKLIDKIAEKMLEKIGTQAVSQPTEKQLIEPQAAAPAAPVAAPAAPQHGAPHYTQNFQTLEETNRWLAQQKNVVITHMQIDTSRVGLDVQKVRVEYISKNQENPVTYQLTEVRKNRFFCKSKQAKVNAKWQEKNPNLRLITSVKKTWGFSLIGGSVGFFRYIKEKYIILYATK